MINHGKSIPKQSNKTENQSAWLGWNPSSCQRDCPGIPGMSWHVLAAFAVSHHGERRNSPFCQRFESMNCGGMTWADGPLGSDARNLFLGRQSHVCQRSSCYTG